MMKAYRFRYIVILCSILLLSVLWEFWLEDLIIPSWWPGSQPETFRERLEYIVTVFVSGVLALLYPYAHASRDEKVRKANELERDHLIAQLQESLSEIKTLRGILPICSYCKKIRDDKDVWIQLEAYLDKHADVKLSHGFCPDCFQAQMSTIERRLNRDNEFPAS